MPLNRIAERLAKEIYKETAHSQERLRESRNENVA
jgi:hypothetical protein